MRFYIDVEDASGNKLGPGPITSAAFWRYTGRMDKAGSFEFAMPATDAKANLIERKRKVRAWVRIDGAWVECGAGIIDHIERTPQADGKVALRVSGDDELRELQYRSVKDLKLYSGGLPVSHSAAVSAVSAFAPAGWTINADGSPPHDTIYGRFNGESVLASLIKTAEKSQNHFYRSGPRELTFASAFTDSGIRAIQARGALSAETCAITGLTEEINTFDLITRIYPRGSGNGDIPLTLRATSRSAPTGYTLNTGNNYIENDALVAEYGVIEKFVDFREIGPIENTTADIESAADMLFDAAVEDLRRRSTELEQATYRLKLAQCSALLTPMQTIRVAYRDLAAGMNVNQDFNILEATFEINPEELRTTDVLVSSADRYPTTSASVSADSMAQGQIYQVHPQLNANSYVTSYNKPVDETETASFRFRFGGEVVQLQQVLFEFQLLPLESNVKSLGTATGGSDPDTGGPSVNESGDGGAGDTGGGGAGETGNGGDGETSSAGAATTSSDGDTTTSSDGDTTTSSDGDGNTGNGGDGNTGNAGGGNTGDGGGANTGSAGDGDTGFGGAADTSSAGGGLTDPAGSTTTSSNGSTTTSSGGSGDTSLSGAGDTGGSSDDTGASFGDTSAVIGNTGAAAGSTGVPNTNTSGGPDTDTTGDPLGGDVIDSGQHGHRVSFQKVGSLISGEWANTVWRKNGLGEWQLAADISTFTGESVGAALTQVGNPIVQNGNHTHDLNDHTHSLNAHQHDLGNHAHSLNSHVHDLGDHTHGLNGHTHSLNNHDHTIGPHSHTFGNHDHTIGNHLHTIDDHVHFVDSHKHTTSPHNHTVAEHNHTTSVHDHTIDAHNHTIGTHNHTVGTHNHTIGTHNHTIGTHNHTVGPHTHTFDGHVHSLSNHIHSLNNHTHSLSEAIIAVYGIFREAGANTFDLADLEYRVNSGSWAGLETSTDVSDGWRRLDITSAVQNSTTLRPVQTNNVLEVRRKTAGATDKTAQLDVQLSVRNVIQAVALV